MKKSMIFFLPLLIAAIVYLTLTESCKKKAPYSNLKSSSENSSGKFSGKSSTETISTQSEDEAIKAAAQVTKIRARENWKRALAVLNRPNIKRLFEGQGKTLNHLNNSDGKKLVWLEALGPHYPAHLLEDAFIEWETSDGKGGRPLITKNFIDWLEKDYIPRELAHDNLFRVIMLTN